MTTPSPILAHLREQEPSTLRWGADDTAPEVVASIGELEIEYATLRKSCVLMDEPQRAVIELAGPDALPFLDRMLTQKLADLRPGSARPSFWLNRQGRIVADLWVVALEGLVLLDVDISQAEAVVESLGQFLFTEDLTIRDASADWHRFAAIGPKAPALVAQALGVADAPDPGRAVQVEVAGSPIVLLRQDLTGEPGIEIFVKTDQAVRLWDTLCASAEQADSRVRPVGWHAFNIARIENGSPLFNLDFGRDALPAETGLIDSHIHFAKGCYLGQEIVARMHSRGHPKQKLVGLRLSTPDAMGEWQPVTGTPLHDESGELVGAVTSSTISPMLGGEPVCFAMVKFKSTEPETKLELRDGEVRQLCVVQAALRFWPRRSAGN